MQKKVIQWIVVLLCIAAATAAASLLLKRHEDGHFFWVNVVKGFIGGAVCVAAVCWLNRGSAKNDGKKESKPGA